MSVCSRLSLAALLSGLVLLGALGRPAAGGEEPKDDPTAKARADAVQAMALAADMEERGRKAQSPLALIAAAEILRGIKAPLEDLKVQPKTEAPDGKAPEKAEAPPTLKEQEALLLGDARSMIDKLARKGTLSQADADALRALATRVEKMKVERGAAGGPKQGNTFIRPGQSCEWTLEFAGGGRDGCVRVFGNGVPVEVTVSDREGHVRGSDSGMRPGCNWTVFNPGTHLFRIRVTNVGGKGTSVRMVTN